MKDLAIAMENSWLQQQQFRHEVSTLEGRCASLLKDAKATETGLTRPTRSEFRSLRNHRS